MLHHVVSAIEVGYVERQFNDGNDPVLARSASSGLAAGVAVYAVSMGAGGALSTARPTIKSSQSLEDGECAQLGRCAAAE